MNTSSNSPLKVALIGLDTSHSVEFPKMMQSPEVPEALRVPGLRAISCMTFETPFQNKEGLARRRAELEPLGVKVTESFDEAVEGADALFLEINDPSLHLEYFRKAAGLGKRIFLDKPLAGTEADAQEIIALARANRVEVMSCSSLRYMPELDQAIAAISEPDHGAFFGPFGVPPVGSGIVWYGVHTAEMLVKAMGRGAATVRCIPNGGGVLFQVGYADGRNAIGELVQGAYAYGGSLRRNGESAVYSGNANYLHMLAQIESFLRTGCTDATLEEALEVTRIICAAERAFQTETIVKIQP